MRASASSSTRIQVNSSGASKDSTHRSDAAAGVRRRWLLPLNGGEDGEEQETVHYRGKMISKRIFISKLRIKAVFDVCVFFVWACERGRLVTFLRVVDEANVV